MVAVSRGSLEDSRLGARFSGSVSSGWPDMTKPDHLAKFRKGALGALSNYTRLFGGPSLFLSEFPVGFFPPSGTDGKENSTRSGVVRGLLQERHVRVFHFEHCCHDSLRLGLVRATQQFLHIGRHDLPGDAELVLQAAALDLLSSFGLYLSELYSCGVGYTMPELG